VKGFTLGISGDGGASVGSRVRVQCPVHRFNATCRCQFHNIRLQRRGRLPLNGVIGVSGRRPLEPCDRSGACKMNRLHLLTHHEFDLVRGWA